MTKQKSFIQLFIPIYIELILTMLMGLADTFMLSGVAQESVGAVGTSNSYIMIFLMTFSIISSGMTAVMTQYIGAKKENVAQRAFRIGLVVNSILGFIISLIFLFFAKQILIAMSISNALLEDATTYTLLIGGSAILSALTPIYSNYLRANGHTSGPLIASFSSNVLNVAFNALFIYVFKMGVMGVALATIISKVVNLAVDILLCNLIIPVDNRICEESYLLVFSQIIKIGLPAALESIMYTLSMSIVMIFINRMDSDGFNATVKTYASSFTTFGYMASAAIASSNAIMVGWKCGEGKFEETYKMTNKHWVYGVLSGVICETLLLAIGYPLCHLFHMDTKAIPVLMGIFALDIVLELGRATNLVMGQALKTTGDATFTVVISIFFTLLCAVGGTYLFGIQLHLLVFGAFIGLTLDECVRGVCMVFRWKTKIWQKKVFVKNNSNNLVEEEVLYE